SLPIVISARGARCIILSNVSVSLINSNTSFVLLPRVLADADSPLLAPIPYGKPPDFGGFPGAPPGMGIINSLCFEFMYPDHLLAPPGMSAPGTGPPPGMQQSHSQQPGRLGGFPPNFQPPPNMPNI